MILLPDVLAAVAGVVLAYMVTTRDKASGDLARLLGMRLVALFDVMGDVDADVGAVAKATIVGRLCFSKLLFWDNKYQVRVII